MRWSPRLPDNPWTLPFAMIGSAIAGGVCGYILALKTGWRPKFGEVVEEVEQLEIDFGHLPDPATERSNIFDKATVVLDTKQYRKYPGTSPGFTFDDVNPEKITVTDEWDYSIELPGREGKTIYQIHYEEFINNEMEFDQGTLTYFVGDDILVDEADVPISNHRNLVGDLKFGYGTVDPFVAYVRHLDLRHEWEVLLNQGSYAQEVLGEEVEKTFQSKDLKHGVMKFRMD